MANNSTFGVTTERDVPAVRKIGTTDLRDVLAKGWDDFLANPTQLVFLSIIYPIVGLVAALVASGSDLVPLVWPLVFGFALIGPVAAVGIYELSRRREQGLPVSWINAFDVLRSPALSSIVLLGTMLLAIYVVWVGVAKAIYASIFGSMVATSIPDFVWQLFHTGQGWRLIIFGNIAGLIFAALVLMLAVVSFPMLLDRSVDAGVAVRTSIRAVLTNPGPMALWGVIVAVLLALGCVPLFIGLAIVFPVLGHATWHLYRKLVP